MISGVRILLLILILYHLKFLNCVSFADPGSGVETSSFKILRKDFNSISAVEIGEAVFKSEHLVYKGKKVISYVIDISFLDGRIMKREKFETISDARTLELIYSRYQDFESKRVVMMKEGKQLNVFAILNGFRGYNRKINFPAGSVASGVLYLKLNRSPGIEDKIIKYTAINEDNYMSYNVVSKGSYSYRGINDVDIQSKKTKMHVFANSYRGEKSMIYYDMDSKLAAIKILKPGISIVFMRN